MKAFAVVAIALLLLGGLTACQSSQVEPTIDNAEQADQVADDSVDSSVVAENDDVELGEMV